MDQEINKLSWFMKGPFFTIVPTPTEALKSDQEIVDYLNKHNLTIVNFDVVSNLRKVLAAKEKEWEEERKEMMEEIKKLQMKKDLCMASQSKLLQTIRKVGQLTGCKESFGSEESKFVLVGQANLDQFYDHVKSVVKEGTTLSPNSSHLSPKEATTVSTANGQEDEVKRRKGKKAKRNNVVIYSSSSEAEDDSQEVAQSHENKPSSQPVKSVKRKIDHVLPPPPPKPSSFNKSSSPSSSSSASLSIPSFTKWRCAQCDGRCETREEYKDHCRILHRIPLQLKDHGQHLSESLRKKASSQHCRVPFKPPAKPIPRKSEVTSPLRCRFEDVFITDNDKGNKLIAECVQTTSVNCNVCGDSFRDMSTLNFHLRKKHNGRGGTM